MVISNIIKMTLLALFVIFVFKFLFPFCGAVLGLLISVLGGIAAALP